MLAFATTGYTQTLDWAIGMGGTGQDHGREIALDGQGNIIAFGHFTLQTDMAPSNSVYYMFAQSNMDLYLAKYDPNGDLIWARPFYGGQEDYGYALEVDDQDNIYIAGPYKGDLDLNPGAPGGELTSFGEYDLYLAKYDNAGEFLWGNSMGGSLIDWCNDIAIDTNGDVLMTGYFYGVMDVDPSANNVFRGSNGGSDVFLLRYDQDGNYISSFAMGGQSFEAGNALEIGPSGQIIITGYHGPMADMDPGMNSTVLDCLNKDIFLASYNSNGQLNWAKGIGGTTNHSSNCEAIDLAVDGSGNSVITGIFWGTADFDPSMQDMLMTPIGSGDIFAAKYDHNGELIWARQFGGTAEGYGNAVVLDAQGNSYYTGYFSTSTDFDPGSGTLMLNSAGGRDVYIASLDDSGQHRWAIRGGGTEFEDSAFDIEISNDSSLFVTGMFMDEASFDPSGLLDSLYSAEDRDIFIARYDIYGVPTDIEEFSDAGLLVYPNPATDNVVIDLAGSDDAYTSVRLIDAMGRTVLTRNLFNVRTQIALNELSEGAYILMLEGENSTLTRKLLVHK